MMYLLGRHILARNFFLRPDYVHYVPEAVRPYHAKRFREAYETEQPHQRRQGRPARPLLRRLDGYDGGRARTARSTASTPISLHKLDDEIICSNGPCWSPDNKTFYFADTWTGEIWAYDYDLDTGSASPTGAPSAKVDSPRRRRRRLDGRCGRLPLERAGLRRQARALPPDGRRPGHRDAGEEVTSVMFGGPNLDILYVTSMAKPPLPRFPGDGVLRGSLFAIHDLGIRGVPEPRFAG